jgi:hypothetical protein
VMVAAQKTGKAFQAHWLMIYSGLTERKNDKFTQAW